MPFSLSGTVASIHQCFWVLATADCLYSIQLRSVPITRVFHSRETSGVYPGVGAVDFS